MVQVDGPYKSYAGSPVSKGVLQFDMWNVRPRLRARACGDRGAAHRLGR